MYLIINPVALSLKINNVAKNNDYIISDFILEENNDYNINFSVTGNYDGSYFQLCYLYVENMIPKEKVILESKNSNDVSFKFKTDDDFEYYFIRIVNLNKNTELVIDDFTINDEEYLINSLFVPYQYIHQIELTKYDVESVSHRFDYYIDSINILKKQYFIFGGGVDTFAFYAANNKFDYLENDPHSYLFQLWLDVGIYGFIYVLSLILFGIFYMWKYRKTKKKLIWFCIFSLCMLILPFDCVYSVMITKVILMLSFLMICPKVSNK